MTNKSHWIVLALIWAVATAVGVAFSLSVDVFPSAASQEAHIVDSAMTFLLVLSVPVFALVVILLGYSMVRFHQHGLPSEDGPPIRGNMKLELVWVLVSLALVIVLAGYGSVGLLDLRAHAAHAAHGEDALVVQVQGNQWFWEFYYPAQNIRVKDELRLPLGKPVHFEITANDVLHSFWVPAFRTKIDAVPGLVTTISATPDKIGRFQEDYHFRVQCAELCGLGHGAMATPVVVVEQREFDAWVVQQVQGK